MCVCIYIYIYVPGLQGPRSSTPPAQRYGWPGPSVPPPLTSPPGHADAVFALHITPAGRPAAWPRPWPTRAKALAKVMAKAMAKALAKAMTKVMAKAIQFEISKMSRMGFCTVDHVPTTQL